MATVADTWTGNQDDGDPLSGTNNMSYLTALRAGINDIDNSQINANAGIAGSKLADLGVSNAKIANTTIQDGKLLWNDATNGIKAVASTKPQRKELWGAKSVTFGGATVSQSATITFAADAVDGASAFAVATDLIVTVTVNHDATTAQMVCYVSAVTATTATIILAWADNAAHGTPTKTVYWHALGRTA